MVPEDIEELYISYNEKRTGPADESRISSIPWINDYWGPVGFKKELHPLSIMVKQL